jgi:hypothetical protein
MGEKRKKPETGEPHKNDVAPWSPDFKRHEQFLKLGHLDTGQLCYGTGRLLYGFKSGSRIGLFN